MELQRKHDFNNIFRLNNETVLGLHYIDVKKDPDEFVMYQWYGIKGYFIVHVVISPDKKIQKRFKNGTMRTQDWNNAKGYDISNLILIKDKLYILKEQLRENEVFEISGYDDRRYKIYKRFLAKDQRFIDSMTIYDEYLYLHKDSYHKQLYDENLYDGTASQVDRLFERKILNSGKDLEEHASSIYGGVYSKVKEKERKKEIAMW